jgi:hypothetical protein
MRAEAVREPLETFSPGAKLLLVAEIAVLFARVRLAMRRNENLSLLVSHMRAGRPAAETFATEEVWYGRRMGSVVVKVVRLFPGDSRCLARSLVLLGLLSRRGIAPALVLGVRTAPSFGAHAWVELAGNPLLEPIEPGGQRLTTF